MEFQIQGQNIAYIEEANKKIQEIQEKNIKESARSFGVDEDVIRINYDLRKADPGRYHKEMEEFLGKYGINLRLDENRGEDCFDYAFNTLNIYFLDKYESGLEGRTKFLTENPMFEEIDSLKKEEIRSEEDTFYLLLQIWWKYNDYFRENNADELSQNIKNKIPGLLNELLSIFDENDDNDLMMKGELLRELGRFPEAEKTLNKINTPEYSQAKQFILDLVKNEVSELRELKF